MALFPLKFGETAARLISTLLASTATGKGASLIGIEDAGAIITATTVEGALAECRTLINAGMQVVKRTVTITQADDLAGLGAGVKTLTKSLGAVLPANTRLVGYSVGEGTFTGFQNAGDTASATIEIGDSAAVNNIMTSLNVQNGQTGFPKIGTAGSKNIGFGAPLASGQATVKLTSNADLNTLTAGAVTVNLFYIVLA